MKKIKLKNQEEGLPITAIREIKILKDLHHPNMVCLKEIVTSKGAEADDDDDDHDGCGNLFIVLEYVDHDLSGLLDMGYEFEVPVIKSIMWQLLDVLDHMHSKNYIHRDIKCSNLLIDYRMKLKLADFGLSREMAEFDDDCEYTNKVITLWYRAPEILLGATKYGKGVDMWSVGCILAEILMGRPIFPAQNEVAEIARIWNIMGTPSEAEWPSLRQLQHADQVARRPLADPAPPPTHTNRTLTAH